MSTLLDGSCPHDLSVLRARAADEVAEARLWAASLLMWERTRCEAAAELAIELLEDDDQRVQRAALRSLSELAPRLTAPLDDALIGRLADHVARRARVGHEGALTTLRWLAPERVNDALSEHLRRSDQAGAGGLSEALAEALLWALESGDASILGPACERLLGEGGRGAPEAVDVIPSLMNAVVELDFAPAAAILVSVGHQRFGDAEPPVTHWFALVLIAGFLGLAEDREIEAPDLRELGQPRPATATNWLTPALRHLGAAGVEVEGLQERAAAGQWVPVLRALLEDLDDVIEDPPPRAELPAALLRALAALQRSGSVPPIMMPWAALVAAGSRLRLSPERRRRARAPRPDPLPRWDASLDTVLVALGSDHLSPGDREELALRALRLAGHLSEAGSARPAEDAEAAIREAAGKLWTDGDLSKAHAGLLLLVACGDERGIGFVRSTLDAEEVDAPRLVRACRAVGFRFEEFAQQIEELLTGDQEWRRARALRVLAASPTRDAWAERLAGDWERCAAADMESLVALVQRLPHAGICERMIAECVPRTPRTAANALALAALVGADAEVMERLRKVVRTGTKSGEQGELPDGWLELRCSACGRISAAPVDRVAVDPELVQSTNGSAGVLPGSSIRCPCCDAVDELAPLVSSAMALVAERDRPGLRPAQLRAADGSAFTSVRAFLAEGYDADLPAARMLKARRLLALGRIGDAWSELEGLRAAESDLIRALAHLEDRDCQRALDAVTSARARMKLEIEANPALESEAQQLEEAANAMLEIRMRDKRSREIAQAQAVPLAAPGVRAPKRNDPCPCGSGRKYKHCCLTR